MIQFILNERLIKTSAAPGMTILDFIRYEKHLMGTKIGCREGDCGACTILIGELIDDDIHYSSVTSCLMAIGNAHGKHIVTIEGLNMEGLNAVQQAFADEGATQCGFCTPGFIVSLCSLSLRESQTYEDAIEVMNGNICRCTGYKSIERAGERISKILAERNNEDRLSYAIKSRMIPEWFKDIKKSMQELNLEIDKDINADKTAVVLGGGTDIYVQRHDTIEDQNINFIYNRKPSRVIIVEGDTCVIESAATVTDLANSIAFKESFPNLKEHIKLVSSTQIRNMATLAGNFINASPIGDFTIFFLALNASVVLVEDENERTIALRDFYLGYKVLDKRAEEYISKIKFKLPVDELFNFEKVSKRTHLDIASVNSAIHLKMDEQDIVSASVAAGGVGPIPKYLFNTSEFLTGKKLSASLIEDAIVIAQGEISPISDARGSEQYKRLLLGQLIKAHFIKLFPNLPLQKLFHN
ncbi:MAG: FAD binding domain-containing protein [Ferruginibacter sp.]